jgi:hypothetical protein
MIVEFIGDQPPFALREHAADAHLIGDGRVALIV